MRASIFVSGAIAGLALLGACSDPPPPAAAPAPPAAPKPAAARKVSAVAPVQESALQEARKRQLTKDDFTESDANRDPFRSFLKSFIVVQPANRAHPILLERYSIEELKLAGIITGELQPRAMFIDPSGQGVTVVRGNHISKVDAIVTRVASDRVYLHIEEAQANGAAPRIIEQQIELHAGELNGP
ncbi:MAG: pilus assembly protein PilP [Polyangia bacterium]